MVNKNKRAEKRLNIEKYVLCILIIFYISGIVSGCYFISAAEENKIFAEYLNYKDAFKIVLYFVVVLLLKYSGIFSAGIYLLPFFAGINNSAKYYKMIANRNNITFETVLTVLKDTASVMLLMLYSIIIILQIINKKYNLKKDIKYFTVYIIAVMIILALEYILKNVIF